MRFYATLNEFLPPERRQQEIAYPLNGPVSIKHVIESLGVPHTEVALILANGEFAGFDYPVQKGDRLAVYPHMSALEMTTPALLRPPISRPPRFVLDVHLGRLAAYLRLLGFDTLYWSDCDDATLAANSAEQERVLVTRDRRLLMRKEVVYGCCLHSREPLEQLDTLVRRYDLAGDVIAWRRCLRCNGLLQPVEKESIVHRLEPLTARYFDDFHICLDCEHIYWKGSHFQALQTIVGRVQSNAV